MLGKILPYITAQLTERRNCVQVQDKNCNRIYCFLTSSSGYTKGEKHSRVTKKKMGRHILILNISVILGTGGRRRIQRYQEVTLGNTNNACDAVREKIQMRLAGIERTKSNHWQWFVNSELRSSKVKQSYFSNNHQSSSPFVFFSF